MYTRVKLGFQKSFMVIGEAEEERQAIDLGEEQGEREAAEKRKWSEQAVGGSR